MGQLVHQTDISIYRTVFSEIDAYKVGIPDNPHAIGISNRLSSADLALLYPYVARVKGSVSRSRQT